MYSEQKKNVLLNDYKNVKIIIFTDERYNN